jgi:hypothetical protein
MSSETASTNTTIIIFYGEQFVNTLKSITEGRMIIKSNRSHLTKSYRKARYWRTRRYRAPRSDLTKNMTVMVMLKSIDRLVELEIKVKKKTVTSTMMSKYSTDARLG